MTDTETTSELTAGEIIRAHDTEVEFFEGELLDRIAGELFMIRAQHVKSTPAMNKEPLASAAKWAYECAAAFIRVRRELAGGE